MWFIKKIKSKEYQELATRIQVLEQKFKVLELDLELYVRRLKATKGLGKEKEKPKDIKKSVFLNPDGTFLQEKEEERNS